MRSISCREDAAVLRAVRVPACAFVRRRELRAIRHAAVGGGSSRAIRATEGVVCLFPSGGGRNTVRGCPFPHFFSCAGLRTELGTRSSQFRKIHRELENSEAKNCILQNFRYICTPDSRIFDIRYARMAESVDALVSNTNDSNVVPVRPRLRVLGKSLNLLIYTD